MIHALRSGLLLSATLLVTTAGDIPAGQGDEKSETRDDGATIRVRDSEALARAARDAQAGTTILLEPGSLSDDSPVRTAGARPRDP